MFNLVERRRWFFLISAAVILPGIIAMVVSTLTTGSPFRLSIEFVGGSIYDLKFEEEPSPKMPCATYSRAMTMRTF